MIDFENVYPKEGDEVLFWVNGDERFIEKIADILNTTPYVLHINCGRTERFCI